MFSLLFRTPHHLLSTKLAGQRVWEDLKPKLRAEYPTKRSSTDPESFDEYLATRDDIETEQNLLAGLPALISHPRITGYLDRSHWASFDVPPGEHELLLSDNPIARTNGLRNPGGHLAMPLSPRRLLVVAEDRTRSSAWTRLLFANFFGA
jgi:hypothetical protein